MGGSHGMGAASVLALAMTRGGGRKIGCRNRGGEEEAHGQGIQGVQGQGQGLCQW